MNWRLALGQAFSDGHDDDGYEQVLRITRLDGTACRLSDLRPPQVQPPSDFRAAPRDGGVTVSPSRLTLELRASLFGEAPVPLFAEWVRSGQGWGEAGYRLAGDADTRKLVRSSNHLDSVIRELLRRTRATGPRSVEFQVKTTERRQARKRARHVRETDSSRRAQEQAAAEIERCAQTLDLIDQMLA